MRWLSVIGWFDDDDAFDRNGPKAGSVASNCLLQQIYQG